MSPTLLLTIAVFAGTLVGTLVLIYFRVLNFKNEIKCGMFLPINKLRKKIIRI